MANERFSSWLINEGGDERSIGFGSLSRMLVQGILLLIAGIALVWLLFFLLANA